MNDFNFHRMTPDDFERYQKYYQASGTLLTDLTFSCRMAWDPVFRTEITYCEDCCLMISDGGNFTDPHLLMPLGSPDSFCMNRLLQKAEEEFDKRGWKLKVMCIEESKLSLFENLTDYEADLTYTDSASDYVYDADALRSLAGNVLHKKRNHVNRFLRMYPNYQYRRLCSSDMDRCLELVRIWCASKAIDPDDYTESDYRMIEQLFLHYDRLALRGGLIEINSSVKAFSIGSLGNGNTAFIHFEKGDAEIDGIYAAINRLTLENEFPEASFVNREEDMGIAGLRQSKQSYDPILLRRKYRTWPINRKM